MKEKQIIEDMAKHCHFCEKGKCLLLGDEAVDRSAIYAKSLYNAGAERGGYNINHIIKQTIFIVCVERLLLLIV